MKLKLHKKPMKNLSHAENNIPANMTPQVAGGNWLGSWICPGSRPCKDTFQ